MRSEYLAVKIIHLLAAAHGHLNRKQLLVNTQMPVSRIISEVGFSNRSYFYRLFEETYGVTPAEYHRNACQIP